MTRSFATLLTLLAAGALHAGSMSAELDVSDVRNLDKYFGRFGYVAQKTVILEPKTVRIYLPEGRKGIGQTSLYSYFALAGDFEVGVNYYLVNLPPPTAGYGASFGIAVDTDGRDGNLSFQRGIQIGNGSGYIVSRGVLGKDGRLNYDDSRHFKTSAKNGRLVLRREGKNLLCLAAENAFEPLSEICKIPFTTATIRKVRIFADPGGSPTVVDVRFGGITIKAEEITGGIPLRDRGGWLGWIVAGVLVLALGGGAGWYMWRRRRTEDDE